MASTTRPRHHEPTWSAPKQQAAWRPHLGLVLLAVAAIALTVFLLVGDQESPIGGVAVSQAEAAAGDFSLDFIAAAPGDYDHLTSPAVEVEAGRLEFGQRAINTNVVEQLEAATLPPVSEILGPPADVVPPASLPPVVDQAIEGPITGAGSPTPLPHAQVLGKAVFLLGLVLIMANRALDSRESSSLRRDD